MSNLVKVLLGVVGIAVFVEILALLGVFSGRRPDNLGVREDRLVPCPESPNCVSTQAEDTEHQMEPLHYATSLEEAKARILEVVHALPRTRVVVEEPQYLYVEFKTPTLRFVDDVEFLFDDTEHLIHFRSASRLGYSDMGLNRRRMEQIRDAFNKE